MENAVFITSDNSVDISDAAESRDSVGDGKIKPTVAGKIKPFIAGFI